jgi:hypothetical protein
MRRQFLDLLMLALATSLACLGCNATDWPQSAQASNCEPASAESLDTFPRQPPPGRDPIDLLRQARANYEASVSAYTVTLVKQERDERGRLGPEEVIQCRQMRQPSGVFLKWRSGATRVDKALYAPAVLGAEVFVHPTGLPGLLTSCIMIDPDGKHAEAAKQVTTFGFASVFDALIERAEGARASNDLTTVELGESFCEGQATTAFQWVLPRDRGYPYGRVAVHLCRDSLLPVAITMWDWDEQLVGRYVYKDLETNVELTADDFSLKACGLQ